MVHDNRVESHSTLWLLLSVFLFSSFSSRPPFHFDYYPTFGLDNETEFGNSVDPHYGIPPPLYPGSRRGSSMTSLESSAWLYGGYDSDHYRGDLWSYNITSATWSFAAPHQTGSNFAGSLGNPSYPGARYFHSLVSYSSTNRLRLFGGWGPPVGTSTNVVDLQDVWDYDVGVEVWSFRSIADGSESWSNVGSNILTEPFYPSGRYCFSRWVYEDDLFVFGGNQPEDGIWQFHDSSTTWSFHQNTSSDVPNEQYACYCWSDSREPHHLFLFGGGGVSNSNKVYSYSVIDNVWKWIQPTVTESLPGRRRYGLSIFVDSTEFVNPLINDSYALIIGGFGYVTEDDVGSEGFLGSVWGIDPILFFSESSSSQLFSFVPTTNNGLDNLTNQFPNLNPLDAFCGSRRYLQGARVGRDVVLFGGYLKTGVEYFYADVWLMKIPCQEGWGGDYCDDFICFGELSSSEVVCSGHGSCISMDQCECDNGWNGAECEESLCFGSTCNEYLNGSNWQCVRPNICECLPDYVGSSCQYPICYGVPANDSLVCGGGTSHGSCVDPNTCHCTDDYVGVVCELPICYGHHNATCGAGICVAPNTCGCPLGEYVGPQCEHPICYGIAANESTSCWNGTCTAPDECDCAGSGYSGSECQFPVCYSVVSNNGSTCQSHGACIAPDSCHCSEKYGGNDCGIPICYGFLADDHVHVCSRNGTCYSPDSCACEDGYDFVPDCSEASCYGVIPHGATPRCSGNGYCTSLDHCECYAGRFAGKTCQYPLCEGLFDAEPDVCHGRGRCIGVDHCQCFIGAGQRYNSSSFCGECQSGFVGETCSVPLCNGLSNSDRDVCLGRGRCLEPNQCRCDDVEHWKGPNCEIDLTLINGNSTASDDQTTLALSLGLGLSIPFLGISFCFIVIVSWICFSNYRKRKALRAFDRLGDADILLAERNASLLCDDYLDEALFDLDFNDVELVRVLDVGGSGATVYVGRWHSEVVAVKMFNLTHQRIIPESLERELDILSRTRHPNILRFIGTAYQSPRVALVTEFCEKGDLKKHLKSLPSAPLLALRIQMLLDIASAMTFLHQKRIVHRDLKPSNVLVADDDVCKLTDFGLSRVFQDAEGAVSKTGAIGTCAYMAPEMVTGQDYSNKIDVFSFGILLFVIVSLQFEPYGNVPRVEYRVAHDPLFRPPIAAMGEDSEELISLAELCWSHDPSKRPNFNEIGVMLKQVQD